MSRLLKVISLAKIFRNGNHSTRESFNRKGLLLDFDPEKRRTGRQFANSNGRDVGLSVANQGNFYHRTGLGTFSQAIKRVEAVHRMIIPGTNDIKTLEPRLMSRSPMFNLPQQGSVEIG